MDFLWRSMCCVHLSLHLRRDASEDKRSCTHWRKQWGKLKQVHKACPSPQGVSAVRVQTSTYRSQLAQRLAATKALSCDKLSSISLLCSWRPGRNLRVSDLLQSESELFSLDSGMSLFHEGCNLMALGHFIHFAANFFYVEVMIRCFLFITRKLITYFLETIMSL